MRRTGNPLSCEERVEVARQFIWCYYIKDEDLCQTLYLAAIEANGCRNQQCLMKILNDVIRKYHEEESTRDINVGLLEEEILHIMCVKEFSQRKEKTISDILSEMLVHRLSRCFPDIMILNSETLVVDGRIVPLDFTLNI